MKIKRLIKRVDIQSALICVLLVICSCAVLFWNNYNLTYNNIIETLQTRTDAIYNSIDELLDASLFEKINKKEDMSTEIYTKYQNQLMNMREVANVRYLYTAKKDANGKYVYLIDGLPLDSEDFRCPGEYIEDDILSDIDTAYSGKTILPNQILDTSWGKIFLAYYPIHGGVGHTEDVIGVLGIEIDAETQYNTYNDLMRTTPVIIFCACIIAFIISTRCFKYMSNPRRKDVYNIDGLTQLKNRTSFEYDMKNIYRKELAISIIMIDLDHLKIINDQYGHDYGDEYIRIAAKTILNLQSNNGISYRLGGDEFVIVVDTDQKDVIEKMIADIYNDFKKASAHFKGNPDLSIGYAIYDKNIDHNLKDTLKRADKKMYENKHLKR